jgi:hypothetical protein
MSIGQSPPGQLARATGHRLGGRVHFLKECVGEVHQGRDVKALVASLRDITATLAAADPTDKAAVYAEMGIDVTYHQDGRIVVESRPRVVESGVGEAFRVRTTHKAALTTLFSIS